MTDDIGYGSKPIEITHMTAAGRNVVTVEAAPQLLPALADEDMDEAFSADELMRTISRSKSTKPSGGAASIQRTLIRNDDDESDEGGVDSSIGNDRIHLDMIAAEQEMQAQSPAITKNGKDMRPRDRESDTKRSDDEYEERRDEERRREEREAEAVEKEQPAYRGHDVAPDHWGGR